MRTLLAYQKGHPYESVALSSSSEAYRVCITTRGEITTQRWQVIAGIQKSAMPLFVHQSDVTGNWQVIVEMGGCSELLAIVPPEDDLKKKCLAFLQVGFFIYETESGKQYAAEIPSGNVVKITETGLFFVDK